MHRQRKAFTMLELIFVITIIGILSAIAVPKFAVTRTDAEAARAKNLIASVRSAIASERQKRILRGSFTNIFRLSSNNTAGNVIFDTFDNDASRILLQYPPLSCKNATDNACWSVTTVGTTDTAAVYTYNMPLEGSVVFTLSNNTFQCPHADTNCQLLTH